MILKRFTHVYFDESDYSGRDVASYRMREALAVDPVKAPGAATDRCLGVRRRLSSSPCVQWKERK